MKGFTLKGILILVIILGVAGYLGINYYNKFSKSSVALAKESAEAIYKSANLYYINTMMIENEESFFCDFEKDGCKQLSFVSSNKPTKGKISIFKGNVNAILVFKDINYYICNNNVTDNDYCLVNETRNITLENAKNYFDLNRGEKFEGYECELGKDCDESFNSFFEQKGKIIIDKNGKITASISLLNYKYYICDSAINLDEKCLIDESVKVVLDSALNYHKTKSKDKTYNGLTCELPDCDLDIKTITIPTGKIEITKKGEVNAELNYNEVTKYICLSKISEEKCK